jgi:ribosomal protein S18 acetylase RimI-like enzyme
VLTIRPARPHELPLVGEITAEAYVREGIVAEPWYLDELRASDRRAAEAVLLVAADERDELLGTVTYCVPGSPWAEVAREGEAEFRMLAVTAAARRRGVARALVQACTDRAAAQARHTLALSVIRSNTAAASLYEQLGFSRAPERDWRPSPDVDLLVWTRPVAPFALTPPGPGGAAPR